MKHRVRHGDFDPNQSDGCTVLSWVNKHIFRRDTLSFRECCIKHDHAYWYGGPKHRRLKADRALRDCIIAVTGNKVLALVVYIMVRIFGHPRLPLPTRWATRVTILEGMIRGYADK